MKPGESRPIHILLAEDSPGDVELTLEAFKDAKVANTIAVVNDGEQAIDYVRGRGRYLDAERPDLILLDLNMPRKDGREVLKELGMDPELSTIPVVVLTTSAADADVLKSYQLNANAYITKPVDFAPS